MTWTAADTDFVVGVDPANITSYGAALFHKIPGEASPSSPTHDQCKLGPQFTWNDTTEEQPLTLVGRRQTLDYSDNFVWAAAGTNGPDPEADTGRLLLIAWVRVEETPAAVRSDRGRAQLPKSSLACAQ